MRRDEKLYTADEAEKLGRRKVCYTEGHKLRDVFAEGTKRGGVQGVTEEEQRRTGARPAVCDEISCRRCDVVFTASYPAVGAAA